MNIAFFWIGQDLTTPSALVKSVRSIYGDAVNLLQLTDRATPAVPLVSQVLRGDLSDKIMMARLQASQLVPNGERTVILDADMLVIDRFDEELAKIAAPLIVTTRIEDRPINAFYPEHYPEFEGKTAGQVMPYLFSFIGVTGADLFRRLETRLLASPRRFWKWYGDQWTLKQEIDATGLKPAVLPGEFYNLPVQVEIGRDDLALMRRERIRIIHFKGAGSKDFHVRAAAYM